MSLRKKPNVRDIKPAGYTGTTTFLLGHGHGCDRSISRLVALQVQGHCPHVGERAELAGALRRHADWRGGDDGGAA